MAKSVEFQIREAVAIKAYTEPAFRELLIRDPRTAIEGLIQTQLPEYLSVGIVEDSETEVTLVIPPACPEELSEEQLQAVAGGLFSLGDVFVGGNLFDFSTNFNLNLNITNNFEFNPVFNVNPVFNFGF